MIALQTRTDPTRTSRLRQRFSRATTARFRRFKAFVRNAILNDDALSLASDTLDSESDRLEQFESWLTNTTADVILESRRGRWTDQYLAEAAASAARQADVKLRRAGIDTDASWFVRGDTIQAVNARGHEVTALQDRLAGLQRQVYGDLRGIVGAMNQQIMRVAGQGVREGVLPREMVTRMNDRVDKIGITRGRVMADTNVVSTHAEITLDRFQQMGIEQVQGIAEFRTAGDNRVCPICSALQGATFRIEAARGLIPVHGLCRCSWGIVSREPPAQAPESQPFNVPGDERFAPSEERVSTRRTLIQERLNSPEERRIREWLNETRDRIPETPKERTRRLLDNWVRGSSRKVSVELEEAAAREFGLGGVVYSRRPYNLSAENIRQSQADVRRIYRETQQSLAARNIKEVTVYRGVKTGVTQPGALESWTTNKAVAQGFDGHDVMRQTVRAEQILFMDGHANFLRGPYGAQFEVGLLSDLPR